MIFPSPGIQNEWFWEEVNMSGLTPLLTSGYEKISHGFVCAMGQLVMGWDGTCFPIRSAISYLRLICGLMWWLHELVCGNIFFLLLFYLLDRKCLVVCIILVLI